jgi:hypothetical protein
MKKNLTFVLNYDDAQRQHLDFLHILFDWTKTEGSPVPGSLNYKAGSMKKLRDDFYELRFSLGAVSVCAMITIQGKFLSVLVSDPDKSIRKLLRTYDASVDAEYILSTWLNRALYIDFAVVDALRGSREANEERLAERKASK